VENISFYKVERLDVAGLIIRPWNIRMHDQLFEFKRIVQVYKMVKMAIQLINILSATLYGLQRCPSDRVRYLIIPFVFKIQGIRAASITIYQVWFIYHGWIELSIPLL
jgi:hypothetical protein